MRLPVLIFLTFFCLGFQQTYAQRISGTSSFRIQDELDERIFTIGQLEYFEDSTNLMDFTEISAPRFQENFKIRPQSNKSTFDINHTYWVKVSIEKNPESKKSWLLEFYDQTIDILDAYIPQNDGTYLKKSMGDAIPFDLRDFQHKNFEIIIDEKTEGIVNYYFKIQSSQKADIRIALRSVNRFMFYSLNEYFAYGLLYGMIIIIGLYNLLVYTVTREVKYLYYTFYLISVVIYAMCVDGIAFQYLWPNHPGWNQIANGFFSYSIVLWAVLFSIKFLNTRYRSPLIHKALWVILGIKTLLLIIGLLWNPKLFEIKYYDVIPFLFIFLASIYIWNKGYKVARFFVVAYGILFVGVVLKSMANAAILPHSTLLYYSLHLAFLLEMLLLTFALGDRLRILKDNRDRAMKRTIRQMETNFDLKEKVNRELEQKVHERTRELDQKNQLLEEFNRQITEKDEEIKRINSLLDKDNYKLKSNIKQSFQARISNKLLSQTEFQSVFPNKSACLRYLEELKWGNGFTCRNCTNEKYSNGTKLFTRKCSKCGFIDSVTAGTIFHGVKFPLEKAFYLAYCQITSGESQTIDQLSELLDLNKNTVWNFRKKVRALIEESDSKTPKWEVLILSDFHKTE